MLRELPVSIAPRSPVCRNLEKWWDFGERVDELARKIGFRIFETRKNFEAWGLFSGSGSHELRRLTLPRVSLSRVWDRVGLVEEGEYRGWVLDCPDRVNKQSDVFLLARPIYSLEFPFAEKRGLSPVHETDHIRDNVSWIKARKQLLRGQVC